MLTVGTDTYVSVSEADEYVNSHYLSNSTDKTTWNALSENDKEILLRNACAIIEAQAFNGKKLDNNQTLSFPRIKNGVISNDDKIKSAQIEQALFVNSSEFSDNERRKSLISQGVKSFSLGDLSESYSDGVNSASTKRSVSLKTASFLSEWTGGSFNVR